MAALRHLLQRAAISNLPYRSCASSPIAGFTFPSLSTSHFSTQEPSDSLPVAGREVVGEAEGGGKLSGGPKEPFQESAVLDKESHQATGDKRLWRKWIEERLAHSKSGVEETNPNSDAGSLLEENVTRSSLSAEDVVGTSSSSFSKTSSVEEDRSFFSSSATAVSEERTSSTYTRSQLSEDDVIARNVSTSVKESAREIKGSEDLDALISDHLRPTFAASGVIDNSNFGKTRNQFKRDNPRASFPQDGEPTSRSTIFFPKQSFPSQEKKRSSAAKQKATGAAHQVPVEFQLPKVEALDDFEYRVLGTPGDMDDSRDDDFLRELDEIGRSARGIREFDEGEGESGADEDEDWDDEKAQVLTDLALSNLEEFDLEDEERPYRLRADRLFFPGQTYDPEDLDISKPVAELEKPTTRTRKNYSSKEVIQIADFRNPRYLSNFIRESSRILPRRHHQVSAKAQRKINREIKTARILGLMPFTSMGDAPFRFMRSRSDEDAYPASEDD